VVGESKDFGGRENKILVDIHVLVRQLEGLGLKVVLEPEFSSSVEANRFQGKNDLHDASAAAIILQRFLDKNKN
jgi:RNase H-fold protein (predicted Holliday junction resolvase)